MDNKGEKDKLITRLRRIEGQIRGLQKMVSDDKDFESFLQQISAVRAALQKVGVLYMAEYMDNYLKVENEDEVSPEAVKKMQEMIIRFSQLL